jgi:hypothetical protein
MWSTEEGPSMQKNDAAFKQVGYEFYRPGKTFDNRFFPGKFIRRVRVLYGLS